MAMQWTPKVQHYKDMTGNKVLAYEVETKCDECRKLSIICARVQDKSGRACYSCNAQRKHCSLTIHRRTTKFALSLDKDAQSFAKSTPAPHVRTAKSALDKGSQRPSELKNLGDVGILTKVSPMSKVLSDATKLLRTDQSKTNRFRVVSARPYPSTMSSLSPVGPSGVKRTPFNVLRTSIKKEHKEVMLSPRVHIKNEREPNVQTTAKK